MWVRESLLSRMALSNTSMRHTSVFYWRNSGSFFNFEHGLIQVIDIGHLFLTKLLFSVHVLLLLLSVTVLQFCTFIEVLEIILLLLYRRTSIKRPPSGRERWRPVFLRLSNYSKSTNSGFRCSVNLLQEVFCFSFISYSLWKFNIADFFSNF